MCKTNSVFSAFKYNPTVAKGRGKGRRSVLQITSQVQNAKKCSVMPSVYQKQYGLDLLAPCFTEEAIYKLALESLRKGPWTKSTAAPPVSGKTTPRPRQEGKLPRNKNPKLQ